MQNLRKTSLNWTKLSQITILGLSWFINLPPVTFLKYKYFLASELSKQLSCPHSRFEKKLREKDLQDLEEKNAVEEMLQITYNYQELPGRLFLSLNKNQMMKESLINLFD